MLGLDPGSRLLSRSKNGAQTRGLECSAQRPARCGPGRGFNLVRPFLGLAGARPSSSAAVYSVGGTPPTSTPVRCDCRARRVRTKEGWRPFNSELPNGASSERRKPDLARLVTSAPIHRDEVRPCPIQALASRTPAPSLYKAAAAAIRSVSHPSRLCLS